jgi:hypothetical protein
LFIRLSQPFLAKSCACSARFFRQGFSLRSNERHTPAPLTARTDSRFPSPRRAFAFHAPLRVAQKAKPQKTQRSDKMQTERAELYFRQGSSDKVYHLQFIILNQDVPEISLNMSSSQEITTMRCVIMTSEASLPVPDSQRLLGGRVLVNAFGQFPNGPIRKSQEFKDISESAMPMPNRNECLGTIL